MKKIKVLTILLVIVVFAMPAHAKDEPKPDDVNVVSPVPLPVSGGVNVTNTPLPVTGVVNATVSGNVNVTNTSLPVSGSVNANVSGDVNVVNEPGVTVLNNETNPVPVTVQSGGTPVCKFVGLTETPTTGHAPGPIGMNKKCKDEFGTGARMCTTKEFFECGETDPVGPPIYGYFCGNPAGWINISVAALAVFYRTEINYAALAIADVNGLITGGVYESPLGWDPNYTWNCNNWFRGSQNYNGSALGTYGQIEMCPCHAELPVVCCAD